MDFRGRKFFFLLLFSPPVDFSRFSRSNFPKYVRNLNTGGELYKETSMNVAENRIHHNDVRLSYLEVHQLYPAPNVFNGDIEFLLLFFFSLLFLR